jgi:Sulfotransferase domain
MAELTTPSMPRRCSAPIMQRCAMIPTERLLVFEVAEAWQPLCAFLEVTVADAPFPSLNDAEQFRALVGAKPRPLRHSGEKS